MTYIPHKASSRHRHVRSAGLGATTVAPASGSVSAQFFDVEQAVEDIIDGVTEDVVDGVASVVDRGMDRITSVVSDNLDRFVDSPKGTALFDKIGDKAESAILRVVSNQKINLALLGVAGVALMMGSVSAGSRMGPGRTKLAFGIGAAALAAVALGVGSPPALTAPPIPSIPQIPKKIGLR